MQMSTALNHVDDYGMSFVQRRLVRGGGLWRKSYVFVWLVLLIKGQLVNRKIGLALNLKGTGFDPECTKEPC